MKGCRQERFQVSIDHSLGTELKRTSFWQAIEGEFSGFTGKRLPASSSGTDRNLRKISVNPSGGDILIVGNAGCLLHLDEDVTVSKVNVPTTANLALLVGIMMVLWP